LQTGYVQIARDVVCLGSKAPFFFPTDPGNRPAPGPYVISRATLVVDQTGVGKPIVDLLRAAKPPAELVPITITAGQNDSWSEGSLHVAKLRLVANCQALLETRRLQFAKDLPDAPTLVKEFQNYRSKVSAAANPIFEAREGAHDDLLLSVCLASSIGVRDEGNGAAPPIALDSGCRAVLAPRPPVPGLPSDNEPLQPPWNFG
jgi:hypothetical protein